MYQVKISERTKLSILSFVGFIIVFIGVLAGEFAAEDGVNKLRLISTLIVSLGGGLLVSCLVGLVIEIYRSSGDRKDRRLLSELFGVSNSSKDIAIVLPRFPSSEWRGSPEFMPPEIPSKCSQTVKDSRLTNRYSLAFDDIAAARHISAIFVEFGMAPPRIEFDDDAWDSLFSKPPKEDKLRNYKTLIVVGLYSNDVTMEFANRNDLSSSRRFRLTTKADFYAGKRGVAYQSNATFSENWYTEDRTRWDILIDSDINASPTENERKPDFALITTCRAPDGRTCFIVGGGQSRGTRKAASYLRKSWRQVCKKVAQDASLRSPPLFVSLYDLEGAQHATLRGRGSFPN